MVYYRETSPLIGYYYCKGNLRAVDGMAPIDEVAAGHRRRPRRDQMRNDVQQLCARSDWQHEWLTMVADRLEGSHFRD